MTTRHTLALTLALLATACSQTHDGSDGSDAGPAADGGDVVDAGDGVCCPIADFEGCHAGPPLAGGGWAASAAACTYEIDVSSVRVLRETDDRGCPRLTVRGGCGGWDAGTPPPPPPDECAALTVEGDCLAAGCVPTYHDACCSSCEPGGFCADCVDYEPWECRPFADACEAAFCSMTSDWGCNFVEPDCADAVPTDSDSCSEVGCVPAVAAEGFMDPVDDCVPVTAQTCAVSCRAVMPNCPDAMTAESDGFCWTGRCIPARVCGR